MTDRKAIVIPGESAGLKLYRIFNERLIGCETVMFVRGYSGVVTVLMRAAISGRVDIGGKIADHFADVLDTTGTIIETVALDRSSYAALKNKWMRCRTEPSP